MTSKPVVYGWGDSVYVRIVRLVLEEKGVAYTTVPVDVFAEGGPPADYLQRHPFGRIPAFEHDGFRLYETTAITRYIDEAFVGPPLQPKDPRQRARMNQIISIADAYVYRPLVWDIYVERINRPKRGEVPDEAKIAMAIGRAHTSLRAIAELMGNGRWLATDHLTLADLYLAPMLDYFLMTSEGRTVLENYPGLGSWWSCVAERPSMMATGFTP